MGGVWGDLKDIACATLFATGSEDVLTPRNAIIMAERVPASSLVRFTGGGHGRMYQDPQGLAEWVLRVFKVSATEVTAGG